MCNACEWLALLQSAVVYIYTLMSVFCQNTALCVCVYVTASHYSALLFPNSPGAVRDLARNTELGNIVAHFVDENSK